MPGFFGSLRSLLKRILFQYNLLSRDVEIYCFAQPSPSDRRVRFIWFLGMICAGIVKSRDFRLNFLIRLSHSRIFLLSKFADSLIFYLYGSHIPPGSKLHCRLRFCHARSIVIGPRVVMTGDYAYIFNNVTIGKLIPGSKNSFADMPRFNCCAVFGVGSAVFGSLLADYDIVFSANSFCSLSSFLSDVTIWGHNNTKPGVFFKRDDPLSRIYPFSSLKW